MSALITSLAVSGARKADGTPVSSGLVFLYQPGTTTRVIGFRDDQLSEAWTTVSGGIALDAGGRASIWVSEPVDVIVQDSTGTTVATFLGFNKTTAAEVEVENDNYVGALTDSTGAVTQAAGGRIDLDTLLTRAATSIGPDFQYKESGGATAVNVQDFLRRIWIDVTQFGADPAGLADSTTAIQNAINRVKALGGGVVYFPPGTYKISSVLALASATGVVFHGAGAAASIIKQTTGATGVFSISSSTGIVFEDIQVTASSANTGSGVLLTNVANAAFSRCTVSNYQICIDTTNSTAANRQLTVMSCNLSFTNNAASRGVRIAGTTTVGTFAMIGGSVVSGGASTGRGVEITGVTNGALIAGVDFNNPAEAIGFGSASSPVGIAAIGCDVLGGFLLKSDLASPTGNLTFISAGNAIETVSDASAGQLMLLASGPVVLTKSVAGGGTLAPGSTDGFAGQYNITAAGNITISTVPSTSAPVLFLINNNTGGGITVTMGASYKTSAAIAPAAGATIAVSFVWDGAVMRETSRATTT